MAKLPYKFTICPTQEAPKQYTAMCPALVSAMRYGKDFTIDQKRDELWKLKALRNSDFEGGLSEAVKTIIKERGAT